MTEEVEDRKKIPVSGMLHIDDDALKSGGGEAKAAGGGKGTL